MTKAADTPYGDMVTVPLVSGAQGPQGNPGAGGATGPQGAQGAQGNGNVQGGNVPTYGSVTLADGGVTVTNEFVNGKAALAIQRAGEAWPRVVMMADMSDGWYFANGLQDPTDPGSNAVNILSGNGSSGLSLFTQGNLGIRIESASECKVASGNSNDLILTGDRNVEVTATAGNVFLHLPTVDPMVSGALWNNAGVVTVSP